MKKNGTFVREINTLWRRKSRDWLIWLSYYKTRGLKPQHVTTLLSWTRVELSAISPEDRTAGFSGLLSPAEIICQVGLTLDVNGRGQRGVKAGSGSDEQHMTQTSSLVFIILLPSVLIHFTVNLERNIFFFFKHNIEGDLKHRSGLLVGSSADTQHAAFMDWGKCIVCRHDQSITGTCWVWRILTRFNWTTVWTTGSTPTPSRWRCQVCLL